MSMTVPGYVPPWIGGGGSSGGGWGWNMDDPAPLGPTGGGSYDPPQTTPAAPMPGQTALPTPPVTTNNAGELTFEISREAAYIAAAVGLAAVLIASR